MTKLIILRGPSGAGKSSVAKVLHETTNQPTVLIEQDYYKEVLVRPKQNTGALRRAMLQQDVLLALGHGYNVILEGILHVGPYKEVLEELLRQHPNDNYVFYFDVSFGETLKRHSTRPLAEKFGEKEMSEWYPMASRLGHETEIVIPEHASLAESVELIKSKSGLD